MGCGFEPSFGKEGNFEVVEEKPRGYQDRNMDPDSRSGRPIRSEEEALEILLDYLSKVKGEALRSEIQALL